MKCPADGSPLVMSDRQGVEIDYCLTCRGVWLDRGELDKIIDRATTELAPPARAKTAGRDDRDDRPVGGYRGSDDDRYRGGDDDRYRGGDDDRYGNRGRPHKRKSFLSEMFDFD